jgi:hypothetical protein
LSPRLLMEAPAAKAFRLHFEQVLTAISLTSLLGTLLETRLWDVNRNKYNNNTVVADKVHTAPVGTHTTTAAPYTNV